jgi:hypothetical protein
MLKFRSKYKYQLAADITWQTKIKPVKNAETSRVLLTTEGLIYVREGFAWDGCSGPVIDRPKNMRAGCIHDGLYLLMRAGELDHSFWPKADHEFRLILLESGNPQWLVNMYVKGLQFAKGKAAMVKNRKPVFRNTH